MTPKRLAFVIGTALLVAVWAGPLPALATRAFVAHMTMHVSVVALAAPLIAVGIVGTRYDPLRGVNLTLLPLLASVAELAVIWAWHAPVLHRLSRTETPWLVLEQALFLIVALAVWLTALSTDRHARGAGAAALLMATMHMALLGTLLATAPRALYAECATALWGLTLLQDQQWGGVLMLLAAGSSYLFGGLYLLAQLLHNQEKLA